MVECANEKNGQRRKADSILAGAEVCRQRHLAYVELELPHHAPEGINQDRYFLESRNEAFGKDLSVLECSVVSLGTADDSKNRLGHSHFSATRHEFRVVIVGLSRKAYRDSFRSK